MKNITHKRSAREIVDDYQRIMSVVKVSTSLSEVIRITGLSRQQIQTSLEANSDTMENLKNQLGTDKATSNLPPTIVPNIISASQEAESQSPIEPPHVFKDNIQRYVIDASVVGTINIRNRIKEILAMPDSKIVITHLTNRELVKLQDFNPSTHTRSGASEILTLSAKLPERFEIIRIPESKKYVDDCIVEFCSRHRKNLILLTGDKYMANEARSYSVRVEYMEKPTQKDVVGFYMNAEEPVHSNSNTNGTATNLHCKTTPPNAYANTNNQTLPIKEDAHGDLFIYEFHNTTRSIYVYSGGKEYKEGPYKLYIGDEILVGTITNDNAVDFKVYVVNSLSTSNNCKIVFSKKLYISKKMARHIGSDDYRYRKFIVDFKTRHHL